MFKHNWNCYYCGKIMMRANYHNGKNECSSCYFERKKKHCVVCNKKLTKKYIRHNNEVFCESCYGFLKDGKEI